MRRVIESVIAGVILAIVLKALEAFGGLASLNSIFQTFIVGLWPMWLGLVGAFLYWLTRDYIQLRRFSNKVTKWIGLFSYKDDKGSYNDLKGKIKRYIQEELEKASISQKKV